MSYSNPPPPFVTDDRFPGKVYCDDDAGTIIASCVFSPDNRLYRYDGVKMAARVAVCLNACEPLGDDPALTIGAMREALSLNLASWEAMRNAGQIVEPHPCIAATRAILSALTPKK